MRYGKGWMAAALALACGVGCGNYSDGQQVSAEKNDSKEQPNFGSATDIASSDGSRSTNAINSADNGLGGPVQRATGNYQSQPMQGQAGDEELAKQVKVALTTGSMGTTGVIAENQLTKIEVTVENGVVTLRGPVGSPEEKQTIGKQVAGMKGVASVQNELTVGMRARPEQPTPADANVPRPPEKQ